MNEPKLKLTLKPCGDCWLHIDAPSGLKASINLGQRGSMNDQTIVGRTIREVAEFHEDKPAIPEPSVSAMASADTPQKADCPSAPCSAYLEDWAVCDAMGEPKGQCSHCGYKWYDHALDALPENEQESAARIRAERCLPNASVLAQPGEISTNTENHV